MTWRRRERRGGLNWRVITVKEVREMTLSTRTTFQGLWIAVWLRRDLHFGPLDWAIRRLEWVFGFGVSRSHFLLLLLPDADCGKKEERPCPTPRTSIAALVCIPFSICRLKVCLLAYWRERGWSYRLICWLLLAYCGTLLSHVIDKVGAIFVPQ